MASRSAALPLPFGALARAAFAASTDERTPATSVVASAFICSLPLTAAAAAASAADLAAVASSVVLVYERVSANFSLWAFTSASRAAAAVWAAARASGA